MCRGFKIWFFVVSLLLFEGCEEGMLKTIRKSGNDNKPADASGQQLLIAAAEVGDVLAVREYIEQNVDVDYTNGNGQTALMRAARYNNQTDVLDALLAAGADVSLTDTNGYSALMFACTLQ